MDEALAFSWQECLRDYWVENVLDRYNDLETGFVEKHWTTTSRTRNVYCIFSIAISSTMEIKRKTHVI